MAAVAFGGVDGVDVAGDANRKLCAECPDVDDGPGGPGGACSDAAVDGPGDPVPAVGREKTNDCERSPLDCWWTGAVGANTPDPPEPPPKARAAAPAATVCAASVGDVSALIDAPSDESCGVPYGFQR